MKKQSNFLLAALLIMTFGFISCSKDEDESANVQFTFDQPVIEAMAYAEPAHLTGTATSDKTITKLTFTGVNFANGTYTTVGETQEYAGVGTAVITFDMEFFVDSKEINQIEVKAWVGNASKSDYIEVTAVEGEAKGTAYFGQVVLKADSIVWNAENHPEVYTTPNTGAEASTPSFFSIHGVTINNEVKHVLTGDELRSVNGENGSFCFVNVLQNTSNLAYIGSQRGYMFSNLWKTQLAGGTTGRQCDVYDIGGKSITYGAYDTTTFKIIAGSWIGTDWNEARYKFVDSLFLVLGDQATTQIEKLRAYYVLGKIQETLDNATLGVIDNPTTLGSINYARRRTNAGTSGTNVMVENFRAGDYIILKSQKKGKLYYGIMQITQMQDDTPYMVTVEGVGDKLGQEETKELFHKPLILDIKVQTML